MGVDATIIVTTAENDLLSAGRLELVGEKLNRAFLLDNVLKLVRVDYEVDREERVYAPARFEPAPHRQPRNVYKLQNPWRYWGPGYERGPFGHILLTLELLPHLLPDGARVYYGGDHEVRLWDVDAAMEMIAHLHSDNWDDYDRT